MYKFNVNDFIKVRLTDFGKDVYKNYHENLINEFNKFWDDDNYKLEVPKIDTDPNGFTKFQLWDFMRIFGKSFGPGIPNIIEDNSIYLEEEDARSTYIFGIAPLGKEKETKTTVEKSSLDYRSNIQYGLPKRSGISDEEYNKVCKERDQLKEENTNWKIICNALVNNNDLPTYKGADDFV